MSKYQWLQLTNTPNDNQASEWGCLDLISNEILTEKECRMETNGIKPIALGGSLGIYTQIPTLNATDINPQSDFSVLTETENTASERDIIDYAEQQVPDTININPKAAQIDSVNVAGFEIKPPGAPKEEKPFTQTPGFYFLIGIVAIVVIVFVYKLIKKK